MYTWRVSDMSVKLKVAVQVREMVVPKLEPLDGNAVNDVILGVGTVWKERSE